MMAMNARLGLLTLVTPATLFVILAATPAAAQYRYVDDKGATKTVQYKLDIPTAYRDAAEWIGPTGIGKPGLSEEARQTKLRDEAYRRIGRANDGLRSYGGSMYDTKRTTTPSRVKSKNASGSVGTTQAELLKEVPVMCIAGERRVMVTPGHWQVKGTCGSGDPGSWSGQ